MYRNDSPEGPKNYPEHIIYFTDPTPPPPQKKNRKRKFKIVNLQKWTEPTYLW